MNDIMQVNQISKTMSSREIAELCEKRHDHVCRDIDTLNQSYEQMSLPKVGEGYYTHPNTGSQQHRQFLLSREQTIDLITGYRADIRIRINRRWQELEAQASAPAFQVPQTWSETLRLAADQAEQIEMQQSRLAISEPKAEVLDKISHSKGSLGVREAAKALGMGQNAFVDWCIDDRKSVSASFMYRDDFTGRLNAYSHRIKQGFITQYMDYFIDRGGIDRAKPKIKFTPAGVTKIAEMMQKERSREVESM